MKHDILEIVNNYIKYNNMLDTNDKIIVACSGGSDSIALAEILYNLNYKIFIAHLDHQYRHNSVDDLNFVKNYAKSKNIEFIYKTINVLTIAKNKKQSFEEAARNVRYEFLLDASNYFNCNIIATGHNLNDQTETMILKIMRGTGVGGLNGILPVRFYENVKIIRPLLTITKPDLKQYLINNNIKWVEDITNNDQNIFRNKVRHTLIPFIKNNFNNIDLDNNLYNLSNAAYNDNLYLDSIANDAYNKCVNNNFVINRNIFREYNNSIQRRIIIIYNYKLKLKTTHKHILNFVDFVVNSKSNKQLNLPNNVMIYANKNVVYKL